MKYLFSFFVLALTFSISKAQQKEVTITSEKLSDNTYVLFGRGGNIGIQTGEDGVFMIDDQFANITPKILEAIRKLSDKPIKFLQNTHHHGDHTGGNENIAKEGAIIVAHENVRKRMANNTKNRDGSPRAVIKSALPVITFKEDVAFHFNGEDIMVFHVHNAHTDGDAIVYLAGSNVLHMGDTHFNGRYPYIDINSGGSVEGYINANKKALMIINDDTKIIPGHGPVGSKTSLEAYIKMLEEITANAKAKIVSGASKEDFIKDASITKKYDDKGYGSGFINSERMRVTLFASLTAQ
ncbi:MBL fold metallo-hydrolase [Spongiivirga citrea]|uniref:MBL fold metallo-hydrolase n=1 Tax=Spongiivirga citrea TaxID=1481457 RepID=A0A6M0CQD1_9FLAO|nr:MBL fold metallo-hydrolase [Spongiivirga citrea]NER18234.1 MBL fold metallo-hydrolase [Spongiivirga citrea]